MGTREVRVPKAEKGSREMLHGALSAIGQASQDQLNWLIPMLTRQELQMTRKFAPKFIQLQQDLLKADPLRGGLYQQALKSLSEIPSTVGELPPDIQRTYEQEVRQSFGARGIDLASPVVATEEAMRLAGGRIGMSESIRQSRLSTAASLLGLAPQIPQIGPSQYLPSVPELMGAAGQYRALGAQVSGINQQMGMQRDIAIGQGIAMLGGAVAGGAGASGGGAPGGFWGGFSRSLMGPQG